jgi:hypothetical protein
VEPLGGLCPRCNNPRHRGCCAHWIHRVADLSDRDPSLPCVRLVLVLVHMHREEGGGYVREERSGIGRLCLQREENTRAREVVGCGGYGVACALVKVMASILRGNVFMLHFFQKHC